MERADLHIHSKFSDGSETVEEVINSVKNAGLKTFSLTDHDTINGIEKIKKLVPENVNFIIGVEFTCETPGCKCHILGYNYDITNKKINALIEQSKKLRRIKLETRIKYLADVWDIHLNQEELDWLYSRQSVVKTHIANVLVNRKLSDDPISAMKKYLEGCEIPKTKLDAAEAIDAIKDAGGISVWAHPLGGEGEDHISEKEFLIQLEIMKKLGIRGLECYYSRYSMEEIELLLKHAKANNLLISGGSDYHGTNKTVKIGALNCENIEIPQDKISVLKEINIL